MLLQIFVIYLDEEVADPVIPPFTPPNVFLSFPDDSESEQGMDNSSGIGTGSHEENLSGMLSASQLALIYRETDYLDALYIPTKSGLSSVSNLGNYSGSNEDKISSESSENILFTCTFHNVCFENPTQFESHQLESHMDEKGKVECGLCPKKYSTKYLRHTHFSSIHMKERFACSVENCGKVYRQKRYKDNHERMHYPAKNDSNLGYVCDKCNLIVESLETLQQHRLTHSVTKRYPCHVYKKKGYSRLNDQSRHEVKCCEEFNVKIVDGIVVQRTGNTSNEEDESEKPNVKRNLFPSEEVNLGQGSLGTDNLPNLFSQQTLGQGARPKAHSPNLFSQQQTPQQFFPSEKMTKNSSHGKPVVKQKVATKKLPGKKS